LKGSTYVPLIILGSVVGIANFGHRNDLEVKQQAYASRDTCEIDWVDLDNCSQNNGSSGGGYGGSGRYLGPRYYWDRDLGKPVEVLADGNTRVLSNTRITGPKSAMGETIHIGSYSRGGFGTFGHGFSMGG